MTPSASSTGSEKLERDPVGVTRLIARVLRQAHRNAIAANAPDNARGVLYVAHCFADELAIANPQFDRLRFIREATEQ